jgi:WbqC-like protein family
LPALVSTSYLPSIEYFKLISTFDEVLIDSSDIWKKKTVRNRCYILSPNGMQCLSVPVNAKHNNSLTAEVSIDYSQPWIRVHKGALEAAYNTAPFFEFIKDDIWDIYDRKPELLVDLNRDFLVLLLKKLKLPTKVSVGLSIENSEDDFRKLSDNHGYEPLQLPVESFKNYNQVFNYKHPFVPNLSGIDFLANMGTFTSGW